MTTVVGAREHDSGDYSDGSPNENDQDTSGNVSGGQNESEYDSAHSDSEHSERDQENQETERKVDDDEDRSNPQYIPKRGTFYEHDDRTADNGEESSNTISETSSEKKEGEAPAERKRPGRKSDTVNKWSHDKYNENEQMPKSRDELVSIYGYDIRNEDGPPHARRNRRYGRGPNKYTRTWEDVEAYKRQALAQPPRKPPGPEDFPALDTAHDKKKRAPRPRSKSQPSSNESVENGGLRRAVSIKSRGRPRQHPRSVVKKENEDLQITATVKSKNNSKAAAAAVPAAAQRKSIPSVAQLAPVPTNQPAKKPPAPSPAPAPAQPQQPLPANISPPQPLQPQPQPQSQPQPQPAQAKPAPAQPQVPEGRGSKRYSSLRQRPLDTYSPPQPQHQMHRQLSSSYHEFQPGTPATNAQPQHQGSPTPQHLTHPQQLMSQMHRPAPVSSAQGHGPSPPHQLPQQQQQPMTQQQQQQLSQQQQQVRLGLLEQQQLVQHPHHAMHNMPPQHSIGQLQPSQGYAPPAMMPAQYMQPVQSGSSGPVGGLVPPSMYQPPHTQFPHQLYPHQHHNYVSSPVPVYPPPHATNAPMPASQAGGVTYYSCAEPPPEPIPPRRRTAAIPIVRPAAPDRPANTTEKDNIDRIVENMFVRKPWPNTQGGDSKEKPADSRNSQEPPSKDTSQTNSLTSSSISTDSKPSESAEKEITPKETAKSQQEPLKSQQETVKSQQEPAKSQQEPVKSQPEADKSQQETDKSQQDPDKTQQDLSKSLQEIVKIQQEPEKSQPEPQMSQQEPQKSQQETEKETESQKETTEEAVTTDA